MRKLLFAQIILYFSSIIFVSAHSGHREEVETNNQTISLIILGALLSSTIPLALGYLSFFEMEKRELLNKDNYLIPLGISFGVLIFLLFDYASLSAIFAFRIEDFLFQSIKLFIVVALFVLLAGYVSKDKTESYMKIFYIWSFGILIHTLGEGIIMGYNFTQGIEVALAPIAITSFVMHKFVEGGVGAAIFSQSGSDKRSILLKTGLLVGLSIVPGVLLGYLVGSSDMHEFVDKLNIITFTVGFAITMFIIPFVIPSNEVLSKENYFLAVAVGLLYVYFGIILHDI